MSASPPAPGVRHLPVITIRWDAAMGRYRVSVPAFDADGNGVEVVRLLDLVSDGVAEHVSRYLNPKAWEIIETFRPAVRDEYAESLRSEARRALATACAVPDQQEPQHG